MITVRILHGVELSGQTLGVVSTRSDGQLTRSDGQLKRSETPEGTCRIMVTGRTPEEAERRRPVEE